MAMQMGGAPGGQRKGGPTPQMNVTPLVDVVLVLLIIFMVITPLLTKTFWVHTPKQEKEEVERAELDKDPNPPLVMKVSAARTVAVNGVEIPIDDLAMRLRRMFAAREDHVLFFDADDGAPFGFAMEAMDRAREGGAVTIAPLTSALAGPDPGAPAGQAPPSTGS